MSESAGNPSSQTEQLEHIGLPQIVVALLKGVLYRDEKADLWLTLLNAQVHVREYVAVIGLELSLDEAEGYAFLQSKPENCEEDHSSRVPRLVARQQLPFYVSLLLALLRKKLAESDAGGGDARLILSRDEIVELVRVFLPSGTNEAKLIDQIDTNIRRIVELGFLRKLRGQEKQFEVRRIIKAFVDATWLSEFDERLEEYRNHYSGKEEE